MPFLSSVFVNSSFKDKKTLLLSKDEYHIDYSLSNQARYITLHNYILPIKLFFTTFLKKIKDSIVMKQLNHLNRKLLEHVIVKLNKQTFF